MKKNSSKFWVLSLAFLSAGGVLWLQTGGLQAAGPRKPLLEQLQEIRETNRKLLERQEESLKRLEELEKQSSQLKALSKRG